MALTARLPASSRLSTRPTRASIRCPTSTRPRRSRDASPRSLAPAPSRLTLW
ncbi:MAG: hypothetical protein M0C28_18095 [Candidatus Moduliflexus flocculans]|nr:hypothetical protein [Candidatus Moduliflexus flocculans]